MGTSCGATTVSSALSIMPICVQDSSSSVTGLISRVSMAPSRYRGCPSRSSASRSEEHTSELQSLMRISYAVFCLKKKNIKLATINSSNQSVTNTHTTLNKQQQPLNPLTSQI